MVKPEAQSEQQQVEVQLEADEDESSEEEVSGPGGLAGLIMSLSGVSSKC